MSSLLAARLSAAAFASDVLENTSIHYDPAVLESMRRAAQAAFDSEAKPILGVLLGRRTLSGTSVTAWLPAHAFPAGQEANLTRAYELARLEYPSESALGWFRSKHQGEARLSTEELDSTSQLLPGGQSIALVLRPSSQRPLRVSSYLPAGDSSLAGERPTQEFFIHPTGVDAPPPAMARGEARGPVLLTSPPQPMPASHTFAGAHAHSSNRFRESLERLRWAFPVGLLILIALAAVFVSRWQTDESMLPLTVLANTSASKVKVEALRVSARNGLWLIRWDPRTSTERATLEIGRDAKWEATALSRSQYASGGYSIPQHAGDLEVLLRTHPTDGPASEIRARVVGSAIAPPAGAAKERKLSAELEKVKMELQAERTRRQQLQETIAGPSPAATVVDDAPEAPRP